MAFYMLKNESLWSIILIKIKIESNMTSIYLFLKHKRISSPSGGLDEDMKCVEHDFRL